MQIVLQTFQPNFQMKKFEEKAIPLIFRNQSKKFQINPQAIRFFQSIEGKIAVISVAGMYRTGKSYLLNTILLKQKAGFAVGPTTNPKTKGIWVWGRPLILKNQKDEIINVCVIDSEGLGSIEEDINHDLRLFSLTLLISSMFIYNTLGAIDEHAIDSLGLVLRLCERMKSESYNDLPDFYWVLRDFSLALVGRDNQPLSPNKYLEQSLSPQAGDSEVRNKIRQSIRASFPQRTCFTFVRPLTNEEELQKLDTLEIDQLRPEFMEQVIEFRRLINTTIRTKRIKGKDISAEMLVELIKVYTAEINGQDLPQIETGWKYVCARECEQALGMVEKETDEMVNRMLNSLPITKKDLNEKREAVYEAVKKIFQAKTTGNDQAAAFLPEISRIVEKKIAKVEDQMKLKNTQETKLYIKKEFQNNVEKRLKAGQFKSMGELAKQFQVFYQFYRKKCPYKDEIQTGLQCLLKRFSDCSVLFHKSFKTRKDQQIAKLRQEMDRLTHQFQSREERFKHQKTAASDKLAVLQSKLQEINRQNRDLSQQLMRSQVDLEKQKREHEDGASQATEQAEIELIELRKRLMTAEELVRQAECIKNFEINNFRNQFLLKENEIVHLSEERDALRVKVSSLTNELINQRDQRGRKIDELMNSSDMSRNQWDSMRRSLQQKLHNSQQLVLRLESSLETKAAELIEMSQSHQKQIKQLNETYHFQKAKALEGNRDEVKALKEALQAQQQATSLKLKKSQAQYSQKEMQLRMHRLQVDQQIAILNQKLQFVRKQCLQKEEKIAKLQEQNTCYLNMFQQKDNQLVNLNSILDQSRTTYESYQFETTEKIQETTQLLQQKIKQIARWEEVEQRLTNELREKSQQIRQLNQKLKMQAKTAQQKLKEVAERLSWSEEQSEKVRVSLQQQIQILRAQNSKMTDDQKRTAELSLVQLKNYYEMERERLQKRNLQDRKKHQNLEAALSTELENKHRKTIRALQEELNSYKLNKQQLQQNITRAESDFEQRMGALQQERQNQRRRADNKYELLQKKHQELQNQYEQFERNYQQERITFVKRMEGLNFELSRKEKELMQLTSKKQSLQQTLIKKQAQVDSVKKLMNQQIESSLKRVSQIQQKYQKLNQEYMQYRIQTQKQLALTKQKNQFQANKLSELTKQKETGSNKTIERLDKQRFGDLKDQNQKLKAQILSLQGRLQTQRKASRDQQSLTKKQYATLERDFQFLQQKEAISQAKVIQLQAKLAQKGENFLKQLQEMRARMAVERENTQKQIDELREKLSNIEDEKNQSNWTLQKDIALLNEKIKYAEYQRDQAKKQLQQNERRLSLATAQLRKASEKANDDSQTRKQLSDKKHINQIDQLKEALRSKSDQYEDALRKQREELRITRQKIAEQAQKIQNLERVRSAERALQEQNQNLKKEKEALTSTYRTDRQKELEEWKRKNAQLQRKNKELQKKTMEQFFQTEKDSSKWAMQRQNLLQKIKGLQDTLEWQRNKAQLAKSKNEMKKSQSSTHFNITEYRKQSLWK